MERNMDESRKQREEFEKWWDEEGWDKKLSNVQGVMFNRIKTGMFTAWIASREAIKIELLDINQYLAELENKTLSLAFRLLAENVRAGDITTIRAAGIKVKE